MGFSENFAYVLNGWSLSLWDCNTFPTLKYLKLKWLVVVSLFLCPVDKPDNQLLNYAILSWAKWSRKNAIYLHVIIYRELSKVLYKKKE